MTALRGGLSSRRNGREFWRRCGVRLAIGICGFFVLDESLASQSTPNDIHGTDTPLAAVIKDQTAVTVFN